MANQHWAETSVPRYLPERVAQIYYAHGLFCSSHPALVIILTSIITLLCSYPLLNIPLPGNVPQTFSTNSLSSNVTTPRWFHGSPSLYVQQVIMKSTVAPWEDNLILTDAFRGPLAESFKLVELVHNFQPINSSFSLDKICLNIESVKNRNHKMTTVLPEYNCLLLSPGNLWNQDFNKFQLDANLINTVYNHQSIAKGKISISEMLFGLPLQDAGVKRYPLRKKQRVIQFAVTVFLTQYHSTYIEGLQDHLRKLYPLSKSFNNSSSQSFIHMYFPEDVNYGELIPLSLTYIIMFGYVYFLMRKMEGVKSRVFMAFSAVLTVFASLCMTIGICFFFGLDFTGGKGRGKGMFPYFVAIVGLENILVLVKSVVSTTSHLDVKIRVAQGLSVEGWNFTKNLLVEVTILTAGLVTCVPIIQEFCILAIVGLLSDFFLQILFFSTILSLNIDCAEESAFQQYGYYVLSIPYMKGLEDTRRLPRSHSHPRLTGQNVVAPVRNNKPQPSENTSKRLKVAHFWARTRFVQRSFMVGMVLWISVIVYNADTIQNFIKSSTNGDTDELVSSVEHEYKHVDSPVLWQTKSPASLMELQTKLSRSEKVTKGFNSSQDINEQYHNEYNWLKKVDYDTRRRLSLYHWSSILSLYNISLSGSYITILPTINVVQIISPELAQNLRNPDEQGIRFRWQSLAVALDPIDFPDAESTVRSVMGQEGEERVRPFIPTTPIEFGLVAILCIISVIVVTYTFIGLYRCICTRNYAEWRTSWKSGEDISAHRTQVVMEALPIAIEGHSHLIECVSTDGNVIVSSCLGGQVKVWDSISGEEIMHMDRENVEDWHTPVTDYMNSYFEAKLCSKSQQNTLNLATGDYSSFYTHEVNLDSHHNRYVLDKRKTKHTQDKRYSSSNVKNDCHDNTIFCNRSTQRSNVPIWSMNCSDNIVVLGCEDGCLEFWDCTSGELKCMFVEEDKTSITVVKLVGRTVLAAKLNGVLNFHKLDMLVSYTSAMDEPTNGAAKPRRGHVRTGSVDSSQWQSSGYEKLRCFKVGSTKAHTKPISVMEAEGGRLVTGSEDRTLKVFNLEDHSLQYTLHGHYGSITCVFIDRYNPAMAGSGSQDGLLCVWDLQTGSCMYSIAAHDGTIFSLTYSASYVISLGQDERLCVWDRFQGHLLNTISLIDSYCTSLCMLTHNLLVTSKQGCLIVLDAGTGETIRLVKLGPSQNSCIFIRHIRSVGDGIVCDYGDQLRLVRFPLICDKND